MWFTIVPKSRIGTRIGRLADEEMVLLDRPRQAQNESCENQWISLVRRHYEAVEHTVVVQVPPVIAPEGLLVIGMVPWPAPVPAPGTSNLVILPSGARM